MDQWFPMLSFVSLSLPDGPIQVGGGKPCPLAAQGAALTEFQ